MDDNCIVRWRAVSRLSPIRDMFRIANNLYRIPSIRHGDRRTDPGKHMAHSKENIVTDNARDNTSNFSELATSQTKPCSLVSFWRLLERRCTHLCWIDIILLVAVGQRDANLRSDFRVLDG